MNIWSRYSLWGKKRNTSSNTSPRMRFSSTQNWYTPIRRLTEIPESYHKCEQTSLKECIIKRWRWCNQEFCYSMVHDDAFKVANSFLKSSTSIQNDRMYSRKRARMLAYLINLFMRMPLMPLTILPTRASERRFGSVGQIWVGVPVLLDARGGSDGGTLTPGQPTKREPSSDGVDSRYGVYRIFPWKMRFSARQIWLQKSHCTP